MIETNYAGNSCFKHFPAFIEELSIELNSNINYLYRQINMISMELLRNFNVKIVNIQKIHIISSYKLKKAILYKLPGSLDNYFNNSYVPFMGRLARG